MSSCAWLPRPRAVVSDVAAALFVFTQGSGSFSRNPAPRIHLLGGANQTCRNASGRMRIPLYQ